MRRWPLFAVLLGLALACGAIVARSGSTSTPPPRAAPVVDRGTVPVSRATSSTPSTAPTRSHPVPAGSRLSYPRLHVDAPIARVSVRDGVMHVPRDPHTVGWWRDGAGAGDAAGSVVVVGHVNYAGVAGALGVLPSARVGDRVSVVSPGGRAVRYRVVAVRHYPKTTGLPATAFARTGPAQLVLITCGGSFDSSTGNYVDNVVVYAVPL